MMRLNDYRQAMLVAFAEVPDADLARALEDGGPVFPYFIIDHGLGPLWHQRTGREEFRASRRTAEALYLAQEKALQEADEILGSAGIEFAAIKGAANRLLLYENPAIRACHDLDLLVHPQDKVRAVSALVSAGFKPYPDPRSISREMVVCKGQVNIDLHWSLLREGRLRCDPTPSMLDRRKRANEFWVLSPEDALFILLVHPAFAKHLAGWGMGLHRVVDVVTWLKTQAFDWEVVRSQLRANGVQAAAWATLRWAELLCGPRAPDSLDAMLTDLRPGRLRASWLDHWLRSNLSERTSVLHWARLLGFTMLLHDAPGDSLRALVGRYRAHRRRDADIWAFRALLDQ